MRCQRKDGVGGGVRRERTYDGHEPNVLMRDGSEVIRVKPSEDGIFDRPHAMLHLFRLVKEFSEAIGWQAECFRDERNKSVGEFSHFIEISLCGVSKPRDESIVRPLVSETLYQYNSKRNIYKT